MGHIVSPAGLGDCMSEEILVPLDCCGAYQSVFFDERDCPLSAPEIVRATVECAKCGHIVILNLQRMNYKKSIEQEIIPK